VKDTRLIHRLQCRYFLFALLTVLAAVQSQAQQTPTAKTQIIHAGKLIYVRNGHVTADAYITVIGERIAAICVGSRGKYNGG
jgi:hypothetical protein